MICPIEIARDVSALRAARVGDHQGHELFFKGRCGASHEGAGSHVAGDGEEDHMVAGSRDHRHKRSADTALRERYEEFRYDGLFDRRRRTPTTKRGQVTQYRRAEG